MDLAWNPPRRDGGAPITGYIIEKKPRNSPVWEEAARTDGPDTRATVPGLKDGDEYEFRVTAVNKAGPSEPSEPCAPVLVKPKHRKCCSYDSFFVGNFDVMKFISHLLNLI